MHLIKASDYGKAYELIPTTEEHFQRHLNYAIKCITSGTKVSDGYTLSGTFKAEEG
jgi:hypothetical protein